MAKTGKDKRHCMFCGRSEDEVPMLLQGLDGCICSDCVKLADDYLSGLEHQAPSPAREAAYISWSDRWVTVLSREGEMSRVMHRGREIAVPTVFLGQEDGRDYCQDTTDYVLPAEPGDEMKVILRLRRGVLAKKDSIAGWYFGRYEMKTEV